MKLRNTKTYKGNSRVNPSNNSWFVPTMKFINLTAHTSSADSTWTFTFLITCPNQKKGHIYYQQIIQEKLHRYLKYYLPDICKDNCQNASKRIRNIKEYDLSKLWIEQTMKHNYISPTEKKIQGAYCFSR